MEEQQLINEAIDIQNMNLSFRGYIADMWKNDLDLIQE